MHNIMLSYPLFGKGMEILEGETELFVSNSGDLTPYMDELRAADAFITRNVHPTTEMLETCPNLKIIGIPGVGYQSYDMDYLNDRGIAVVYCPAMNLRAVAEHAMAMAYALTKWIPRDDREIRKGNYGIRNAFDHMELLGCAVGVAGFGAIGRETARLFRANGMEVYIGGLTNRFALFTGDALQDLPLVVAIDAQGNDAFALGQAEYLASIHE